MFRSHPQPARLPSLSTPFWEFHIAIPIPTYPAIFAAVVAFYSLLGVSTVIGTGIAKPAAKDCTFYSLLGVSWDRQQDGMDISFDELVKTFYSLLGVSNLAFSTI